MIEKFNLTLKDTIEKQVLNLDYKDHNLSFTNMYMWRDMFELSMYEDIENHFIIIFCNLEGEYFSLNPLCSIDKIDKAIDYLINYFQEHNRPFLIHNCVRKVQKRIEEKYGSFFSYELTRDSYDYLYSAQKLMTYSGKKLQKKRNHLNNFLKNYEGRYEIKIISENKQVAQDCIQFTKKWDETKLERDMYIDQEVKGTIDVLNNFDKLSCEGLAIYIDNELEAFSFGTQLNDTTAVVNVEKANPHIVGLYPFIRKQLVSNFFDDLEFINTEDDVGEENLRKSKLSYQPEYLVEKYSIRRNDEH
ncbi:MAG: phosphatidylglycerol lysyltransferase domain-containing protein [Bacilli bacterium]|jgi:hypothetical protein|nr:phosphatidylglycerol lysyltransferase domain-containing protein [Bacilli bacterium]